MPTKRQPHTGTSDMAQRMLSMRDTAARLRLMGAHGCMVERYEGRARQLALAVIGCGVVCLAGRDGRPSIVRERQQMTARGLQSGTHLAV